MYHIRMLLKQWVFTGEFAFLAKKSDQWAYLFWLVADRKDRCSSGVRYQDVFGVHYRRNVRTL